MRACPEAPAEITEIMPTQPSLADTVELPVRPHALHNQHIGIMKPKAGMDCRAWSSPVLTARIWPPVRGSGWRRCRIRAHREDGSTHWPA